MDRIRTDSRHRVISRSRFEADLSQQILDQKYVPGEKLPSERELALTSGLSRPIVREVLRTVAERGLIEIVPARGAFVRAPDSLQLAGVLGTAARRHRATPRDLVDAREMIESRTAREAAEHASDADVAALRSLVEAFDGATTVVDRACCDLALHAAIARMSANPVLEILFGAIAPMVLELQLRSVGDPIVLRAGGPMHHDIVEAIAQHRSEAAEDAMARHVTLARDLYGADFDVPLDDLATGRLRHLFGDDISLNNVIRDVLASVSPVL